MVVSLSQILYSQNRDEDTGQNPDSTSVPGILEKEVNLTFSSLSSRRMTGSTSVIDVQKELKSEQGNSFFFKVPGLFGTTNTWGTGNAIVLVDGIQREGNFMNYVSLMEVESVVVLKDALSKAMYGAMGDQGVILINTKRGEAGKHELRVLGNVTTLTPRALPNYLNAADYMGKYNEAQLNDGVDPLSLAYTQADIDATHSGANPALYPDNDFYSKDYLNEFTKSYYVFADLMGGDEKARYYMNTEWYSGKDFLNTPQSNVSNVLKFRSNLDFTINKYMTMGLDAFASVNLNMQPKAGDYYNKFATIKPNDYPVLWDPNLIADEELRNTILESANLVDGKLLGGKSTILNNIMGELRQNGNTKLMQRNVQFAGRLNLDLSFITQGLSAKAYGGMQFYNTIYSRQEPSFAVYEPARYDSITGAVDSVSVHGVDKSANKYHAQKDLSDFYRQTSYYATLNYNRSFGEHDISAVALMSGNHYAVNGQLQKIVALTAGLTANYMYADKYIVEVSAMGIGSRKLAEGKRMELAPSFGLGWVLSEEGFMSDVSFVDYLKVRSSFGITKNDNWGNYFLYKKTFERGNSFWYGNGISRNGETSYTSIDNDIMMQKRRDITFGLDAILFDKAMNVELGYFNSASLDNITEMTNTYPQLLGYEDLVYNNYNSDVTQGIEIGINYTCNVTDDLAITAGSALLHILPKITKREEPRYEGVDAELLREGTATDAMWTLLSDGLYSEADFNPDGTLVDGLPVSTYGAVQPGDIKYLDQNGDDVIDQKDQRIVGHGQRTQCNLYLDLRYKNLEFFVLGTGYFGDSNYRSGNYYRVFGNGKYSEMANEAYGPNNKDVNATHPRLSATDATNNNRNSDYWLYKNNRFRIPTMQLTYHFDGGDKLSFLKDSRIYVKGNSLFVFGKNKKYLEVNTNGSPFTRSLQIGFVTSF
jgi:TonB-linked SusC/RagA family outer membrane protein